MINPAKNVMLNAYSLVSQGKMINPVETSCLRPNQLNL